MANTKDKPDQDNPHKKLNKKLDPEYTKKVRHYTPTPEQEANQQWKDDYKAGLKFKTACTECPWKGNLGNMEIEHNDLNFVYCPRCGSANYYRITGKED